MLRKSWHTVLLFMLVATGCQPTEESTTTGEGDTNKPADLLEIIGGRGAQWGPVTSTDEES